MLDALMMKCLNSNLKRIMKVPAEVYRAEFIILAHQGYLVSLFSSVVIEIIKK